MSINLIYITAGSLDEARTIGKKLVETRLAACANIVENIKSIYWWEGAVQEDKEAVIIAKTRETLVPQLIDKVKSLHSYECPCIVSLPILDGNGPFLEWVRNETVRA